MSQVYTHPIKVLAKHIDSLNHVNNEVYIKWFLQAADAHSSLLGFTLERFLKEGACFVVRRHEIDYLAPAFLDEDLVIETWIKELRATRCSRVYVLRRLKDDKILLKAETLWVYIDLKTGRPKEMTPEIVAAFTPFLHE